VIIEPLAVSIGGLTINVVRGANGEIQKSNIEQHRFIPIDTSQQGGTPLQQLIDQLNQIKVPFEDQVSAIEQMHHVGAIHAKIEYED